MTEAIASRESTPREHGFARFRRGRWWRIWLPVLFVLSILSLVFNARLVAATGGWGTPGAAWASRRLGMYPAPDMRYTDISVIRERAGAGPQDPAGVQGSPAYAFRVLNVHDDSADEYSRMLRDRTADAMRVFHRTFEDNRGWWALHSSQRRRWIGLQPWANATGWSEADLAAATRMADEYLVKRGYLPAATVPGTDLVGPRQDFPGAIFLDLWGGASALLGLITAPAFAACCGRQMGAGVTAVNSRWRGDHRLRRGRCPACNYEFSGVPRDAAGGLTCPECGRRIEPLPTSA